MSSMANNIALTKRFRQGDAYSVMITRERGLYRYCLRGA